MNDRLSIRPANREDLEVVLTLCALHAQYEKLPFKRNGQAKRLETGLFAGQPKLHCLLAEIEQQVVGYATFMKQYATWEAAEYLYLDCLFVQEQFRSQGIGKKLMNHIKNSAKDMGIHVIQWQTPDFNVRAIKFYHSLGAIAKKKERFFLTT